MMNVVHISCMHGIEWRPVLKRTMDVAEFGKERENASIPPALHFLRLKLNMT